MKKFLTKKIDTQSSNVKKNFRFLKVSFILLFALISQVNVARGESSFQQQQQIKGKVTDASGLALPGVNIIVVGTTNGTLTDLDGNYTISAEENDVLQFSFVGMETQQVTVGARTVIDISLADDAKTLEEIVVVGYGTQRKNEITGAVSTVSTKDIVSLPVVNVEQALQGRAAGVTIINNGSPGTAPTVRIRGIGTITESNAPTFVVDGVVVDDINGLSPDDIESISVLKDASTAAVYGSLGANGVIVIKTKTGTKGDVVYNFNSYIGTQTKPKSLDLLNTSQYVDYVTDMLRNANPTGFVLPARFSEAEILKNDVDYQDAIFQTGVTQNYQLSASGGNDNATFRLSGGYQNQEGVLLNTSLDKYSFRLNSEFKNKRVTYGETVSLTYMEQNPLILANSVSPVENAIRIAPYLPILDVNSVGGFSELTIDDNNSARNPVRNLNRESQINRNLNLLGNLYAKIDLAKGLEFKTSAGMNYFDNQFKKIELPFGNADLQHNQGPTRITYFDVRVKRITLINSLRYKTTINENHNIEVLVLAEQQKRKINTLNGSGTTDFGITDIPGGLNGGAQSKEYNKTGYLGRINYDFAGKYIFAASLRNDASSKFGANNRSGNFSSIAAGWVISEEDFFEDIPVLSYLKLRGSWGVVGNDKIIDLGYESSLSANYFYGTSSGLAINSLSNPDLKWEEVEMTNIGLDFGFMDDKITFNAEYYSNVSTDLLIILPPAASVGVPNGTPTNIGGMETNGYEFNLGVQDMSKGDFKWSANFNLSTTNNKVTQLAENVERLFNGLKPNVLAGNTISRIVEGESLWHFYGWETDGIFQSYDDIRDHADQGSSPFDDTGALLPEADLGTRTAPGDIRFVDMNDDGVINDDDRTVLGNPFPKATFGLSLDASFKNFDMSLLFTGVTGNDIFNASRYYLDGAAQIGNASTKVLDRWSSTNPSNTQPRAVNGDPNGNARVSNRYVEDGSYTRLKNLSLGYSFSKSTLNNIAGGAISKFRIYISAQNVFTITDYTGYDPEIGPSLGIASTSGNANSELGIDRGQYPLSKSFIAGVQISF